MFGLFRLLFTEKGNGISSIKINNPRLIAEGYFLKILVWKIIGTVSIWCRPNTHILNLRE